MAERLGQQFGNYRLVRLLGRGGSAEVYLGQHLRLNMQAAIKILSTQLRENEIESFQREAETIASLTHPHIVRILDFDVKEGVPFIVMDYAPNGSLRQLHPKGVPVSLPSIVSYIQQVADALQYAHDQKLIHRDVKPENMLLGRRNEVLLGDFGIATVAHRTTTLNIQEAAGTAIYMAPEQFQGMPRPASDEYALGIVVYEWLYGTPPFTSNDFIQLGYQHTFVPPPSLHNSNPSIPPAVEQVVLTALEKDPHRRFATVSAFARALEQASQPSPSSGLLTPPGQPLPPINVNPWSSQPSPLADEATVLPPAQGQPSLSPPAEVLTPPTRAPLVYAPSASTNTPDVALPLSMNGFVQPVLPGESQIADRRVSRRAIVVGLAAGLTGLAAAGGGISWWALSHSQPTSPAPVHSPKPTPTPAPTYHQGDTLFIYHGHSDLVLDVTWSPDDKRIASGSVDRTAQIWSSFTGGNVLKYSGHSSEVRVVPWSPDGTRIASGSDDTTVQVWDTVTGKRFFTYSGHSNKVLDVAWSPDGKRIASGGWDHTVQVWDAATGSQLLTYRGHTNIVNSVAWSPDGKRIASGSDDNTVQVWDATTGNRILTYRGHANSGRDVAWSPNGKHIASGSFDKTVQVWDATTGNRAVIYHGHSGFVYAVAWSPGGLQIASASYDKTVQLWVAATGSHIYTYRGHSDIVEAVAWSPNGKYIASGGVDTTVRVWATG
ncbi:MAG TPA: protein kinase [Ktedonobacteraceae bacterium]|nr:protein kinase [Ktedonobacteraceae bacterium]